MKTYINWSLFSDKELVLDKKKVICTYEKNKYILYKDTDEINEMDLQNKLFKRKTKELSMEIDFKEKTAMFDFAENGKCKFDIESVWYFEKDKLTLLYKMDDSIKKVIVDILEIAL